MKEVKKCSISGVAFTLDTDAYDALESYLNRLKKTYKDTPDGTEIVADIEARIAELILSTQAGERVVEKPLIDNIILQLGSPEDITGEDPDSDLRSEEPRIPRRLYRDTENAKLGGVCAGIGKYFDIDPVWIRLGMFAPMVFSIGGIVPFLHWTGPMFGNLFGIFFICYLIMWFVVPAARSARQKLEMNGERITEQSIRNTTTSAASCDVDSRAKPIVAEAVSVFGKIILICMKIIAGMIVFGLIMGACALVISLLVLIVGGEGLFSPQFLGDAISPWLASVAIIAALLPMILLIYVLMCLIASRKPGGKAVLVIFLLWMVSIVTCATLAIRENVGNRFRMKQYRFEQVFNSQVVIDSDTTTLSKLLREFNEGQSIVEENNNNVRISVPAKAIDITIDKQQGEMSISSGGHKLSTKITLTDTNDQKQTAPDSQPATKQ